MIIDAHYHLDERIETVDRLLDQMDRHNIDRVALIPALNDPLIINRTVRMLGGLMRKALTSKWRGLGLCMYGLNVTSDGKFSLVVKRYPIYDEPENDDVARVTQAHPDNFFGWIGVKTHPFLHRYPVATLDNVAGYCVEKGWPLLIHLGADQERGDYRYLPDRHHNLKIIYAHAGLPFYQELWDFIKDKDNLFVDLSSEYLDTPLRLKTIKALGAKKCLYGTDGPYGCPDTDGLYHHGKIINEINQLPISDEDKRRILGDNFREITGI